MGVNLDYARFLIASRKAGVGYEQTLTLGRQWMFAEEKKVNNLLERAGAPRLSYREGEGRAWADALFRSLGAGKLQVLDNSPYEGATVIHDLNEALSAEWAGRFDFVFDGGVIEHVFNAPMALKSCMQLLRVGGHFCSCTLANNECGHGFYQFSPELFFRLFCPANGFELRALLVVEQRLSGSRWYAVTDPAAINARVGCINRFPLHMMVLARKIDSVPGERMQVQQHDYVQAWQGSDRSSAAASGPRVQRKNLKQRIEQILPPRMVGRLKQVYRQHCVTRLSNGRFFQRVEPDTYSIQ